MRKTALAPSFILCYRSGIVTTLLWLLLFLFLPMQQKVATPPACNGYSAYPCSLFQSNAQLTVIALPAPIPSVGNLIGANRCYTSPIYGNKVCRCTDVNTDPTNKTLFSYEVTDSGGANDAQWNSNGTLLRVVLAGTGTSEVVGVNLAAGTCTVANTSSRIPTGAAWLRTNPNQDMYLNGTQVIERTFNSLNPLIAPTSKVLFNFNTCSGLSKLQPTWHSGLAIKGNDALVIEAFSDRGAQDTGEYVAVYQVATNKCQVWNTLTGKLTGNLGTNGTVKPFYPFTIHDVAMGAGGIAEVSIGSTCTGCPAVHGPYLWETVTPTIQMVTVLAGGHDALGYKTYLNLTDAPQTSSRLVSAIGAVTQVTSARGVLFPALQETHLSWQNVNSTDSKPFLATQASLQLPQPIKITTPLQQELWAADPVTGKFIRIAPTMSSGIANSFNFRTQNAIFSPAPTGKAIAISTDWEGTLGNTDGKTENCSLGASAPLQCRSDVIIAYPK